MPSEEEFNKRKSPLESTSPSSAAALELWACPGLPERLSRKGTRKVFYCKEERKPFKSSCAEALKMHSGSLFPSLNLSSHRVNILVWIFIGTKPKLMLVLIQERGEWRSLINLSEGCVNFSMAFVLPPPFLQSFLHSKTLPASNQNQKIRSGAHPALTLGLRSFWLLGGPAEICSGLVLSRRMVQVRWGGKETTFSEHPPVGVRLQRVTVLEFLSFPACPSKLPL